MLKTFVYGNRVWVASPNVFMKAVTNVMYILCYEYYVMKADTYIIYTIHNIKTTFQGLIKFSTGLISSTSMIHL